MLRKKKTGLEKMLEIFFFCGNYFQKINLSFFPDTAAEDAKRYPKGWGKRHTFAFLAFLGFANIFAMRVNLSVAIIQMVKSPIRQNSTIKRTPQNTKCRLQKKVTKSKRFFHNIITPNPISLDTNSKKYEVVGSFSRSLLNNQEI